jgi:hypothetical protein
MLDAEQQRRLVPLKDAITKHFEHGDWLELGALTGCINDVQGHSRLLRSLSWGDPDYAGHVFTVLLSMIEHDPRNLGIIEQYVGTKFENGGESISSAPGPRKIYFTPHVFSVPDGPPNSSLVSAMMPFDKAFDGVYQAIQQASSNCGLACQRVDDIWESSTVIQDVFSLIFRSQIVVCDFTGRNPNVFYECGIAHTLGKHVVPIAQHKSDVPFDLQHHRYLPYLDNVEGLTKLTSGLTSRFATLNGHSAQWANGARL